MSHPLMFPAQPFSFLLLLLGTLRSMVQKSIWLNTYLPNTNPLNFSFLARFVLNEQGVIFVNGCTNKGKVKNFGLIAMEASAFSGWP